MTTSAQPPARETTIFRNNRSLAVRIPPEFGSPGDKVRVLREGDRLIIEPIRSTGLTSLLEKWAKEPPLGPEDQFPELDDEPVKPEDIF